MQNLYDFFVLFLDKGAHGPPAEDGVIRREVQESQRDTEKVNTANYQRKKIDV